MRVFGTGLAAALMASEALALAIGGRRAGRAADDADGGVDMTSTRDTPLTDDEWHDYLARQEERVRERLDAVVPKPDPLPFVETRQIRRARERAERKAARQTIERYK